MYKVITHNIKEEHFDHPLTAEVGIAKHTGHTGTLPGNIMPKMSSISTLGSETMAIISRPKGPNPMAVITQPGQIGNIGNIGNIKIKMPSSWGEYDAWGDMYVNGHLFVTGDCHVDGSIHGTGSTATVTFLEENPQTNTWPGKIGDLCAAPGYMYLCVSDNAWIRWATQATW